MSDIEKQKEINNVEKQEALDKLRTGVEVLKEVKRFVTFTDKLPLDTIIGTAVPVLGDIVTSLAYFVYLQKQAQKIGLDIGSKIAWKQIVDAAGGSLPLIGWLFDYFYKSNKKIVNKYFKKRIEELEGDARKAGASKEEIENIMSNNKSLSGAVNKTQKITKQTASRTKTLLRQIKKDFKEAQAAGLEIGDSTLKEIKERVRQYLDLKEKISPEVKAKFQKILDKFKKDKD